MLALLAALLCAACDGGTTTHETERAGPTSLRDPRAPVGTVIVPVANTSQSVMVPQSGTTLSVALERASAADAASVVVTANAAAVASPFETRPVDAVAAPDAVPAAASDAVTDAAPVATLALGAASEPPASDATVLARVETTEARKADPQPEPPARPNPQGQPEAQAEEASVRTEGGQPRASFAAIEANGLDNACYPDEEHHLAEFLYQHPEACFWEVDASQRRVTAVATPSAPPDAVLLPAPSGRDDTAALEEVINANAGGAVVGSGTYIVGELDIRVPVDIFDMPMVAAPGARRVVVVRSPDVRIFGSPIDAQGSTKTYVGYRVEDGADGFTLVGGGFRNILHRDEYNAAGVELRGASDFHIACNTFEDLLNDSDDDEKTARANAILMNGGNDESTSGGIIANNVARNHQSNGKRADAEFLTIQSYASTDPSNPVRVYANRTIDAGKRFTKHQEDDALVLSNDHAWTTKGGPLGNRKLLSHVEVQFSDNVVARNNRVKIGAGSRFDYVFFTNLNHGSRPQDGVHYDCNDIEIQDPLSPDSGNIPHVIVARASVASKQAVGMAATNSSANGNRVHGAGSVSYHYWFGEGYPDDGGRFDASGNVFEIPFTRAEYKTP